MRAGSVRVRESLSGVAPTGERPDMQGELEEDARRISLITTRFARADGDGRIAVCC